MTAENTMQWMMDFYSDIYPTRKHYLNQLFCVIGNGYKWVNGELVERTSKVANRYRMIGKVEKANGSLEDMWYAGYASEEAFEKELIKVIGKEEYEKDPVRRHYTFEWYPVCSYSYVMDYPDDITPDWRRVLEECRILLIEDGILDKEGNIV